MLNIARNKACKLRQKLLKGRLATQERIQAIEAHERIRCDALFHADEQGRKAKVVRRAVLSEDLDSPDPEDLPLGWS